MPTPYQRVIRDAVHRVARDLQDTAARIIGPALGDPVSRDHRAVQDGINRMLERVAAAERHIPLLDCQHPRCVGATASITAMLDHIGDAHRTCIDCQRVAAILAGGAPGGEQDDTGTAPSVTEGGADRG
jgi:hypothetical protein